MTENDECKERAKQLGALPCPFCGSEAMVNGFMFHLPRSDDRGRRHGAAVCCCNPNCRASTSALWDDEGGIALAVERWNRRTANTPDQGPQKDTPC